jgi:hypothetical protein
MDGWRNKGVKMYVSTVVNECDALHGAAMAATDGLEK